MDIDDLKRHFTRFKASNAWAVLARNEIKQKYRRTLLGPNWITFTTMVQIACLGPVYSIIFNRPVESYILFISIGLIIWGVILSTINDYSVLFINAEGYILNAHFDVFTFIVKTIVKNAVIFLHSAPILIALFLYYGIGIKYIIIAHLLLVFTFLGLASIGALLAIISLKYRDIPIIVQNILMMMFFLTPIIWEARVFGKSSMFVKLNPFYHMIEVFRAPILYQSIPFESVFFLSFVIVGVLFLNFFVFTKMARRLGNWL